MDVPLLTKRATILFDHVSSYVNTIVIALVIFLGGFILGRIADLVLYKILRRFSFDDKCFAIFGTRRNYERATRTTLVYAIYVLTVYVALRELSLDRVAITFLLCIFLLIVFVSVGFAGIEIFPNIRGRWYLHKRGIVRGTDVELSDKSGKVRGKVERVTLSALHVKRSNGDILFYPNAMLTNVKLTKKRARRAQSRKR